MNHVPNHSIAGRRRLARALAGAAALMIVATIASAEDIPEVVPPAPSADSVAAVTPPAAAPADSSAPAWTPRLAGVRMVRLTEKSHNVVRSGPGERYSIVGVFAKDKAFPLIAKSGDWYNIRLSETETGWVHSSLCKEFDDLSQLEFRPNPRLYSRTGSFVLGGYAGAYAFDRKSNSLVLGGRLGYYVFDAVQVEAGVGWTHVQRPQEIVESLFDLSLEAEDFHMVFYRMDLLYELMPGRQMVPFISGGVGSSIMLGRTEPSFDYGAGTTMFLSKKSAMRWEFRAFHFDTGTDDARRPTNNVEFTISSLFLF